MEVEKSILVCIKGNPGISAKKIVSCMDSKKINPAVAEGIASQLSIFKQLRR